MSIQELVNSVQNDVRQGAYDNEEILLLCEKTQELINHTKENTIPANYQVGQKFRDKAKTDLIHTIIAISSKKDYENEISYFVECEDEKHQIHYDVLKESYLNEEATQLNIWAELRNDFEDDNGIIFIDAWLTNEGEEEGTVIAKVFKNENGEVVVEYKDERAKTDPSAQEIIQESINELKESEA